MRKETTLWLLLAIAVLGAAVWWQLGREAEDVGAIDVPLFEGLDPERIRAFEVDHVERAYQLRLERDARGAWYITDPIVYPADLAVVRLLLEIVVTNRASVVPEVERDSAALGFEPPRAFFTVEEEQQSGGAPVRRMLEIGQLDLDGRRVNVRRDGRILRTLRNLDTTLRRSVFDYRSHKAMQIVGDEVVELNRTGQYQRTIDDVPVDLRLNAVRDGAVWRALVPHQVALDPLEVAVVTHGTSSLQIDSFIDDAPRSFAEYGLETPEFRIELRTADGVREALRFGRTGFGGTWYVCREGEPYVWSIALEDLTRLILPFDDLVDRNVLRVARDEIDALQLECDGRVVRAERQGERWSVSERDAGDAASAVAHRAEPGRVLEILSRLEHTELDGFRLDGAFAQDGPRLGVFVEAGGRTFGGRIGRRVEGEGGAEQVEFQRVGDDVPALAEAWLAELACTRLDELRSLALVEIDEVDLAGLELAHGGDVRSYERSDHGRWSLAGGTSEATELVPVLDPLFFLRASEHVEAGLQPLDDPIEVVLRERDGGEIRLRIGLVHDANGARAATDIGGSRSLLQRADLHGRLLALFRE